MNYFNYINFIGNGEYFPFSFNWNYLYLHYYKHNTYNYFCIDCHEGEGSNHKSKIKIT